MFAAGPDRVSCISRNTTGGASVSGRSAARLVAVYLRFQLVATKFATAGVVGAVRGVWDKGGSPL